MFVDLFACPEIGAIVAVIALVVGFIITYAVSVSHH
jgi:hypothetical protein